jgi:antagonist of KipI
MDPFASRAASTLAGNPPDCAVIELGLGDLSLRALQDCVIAVAGDGFRLSIYIWDFPLWSSFFVRAGWNIMLNKIDGGMWAYIAIAGDIQMQPTLGSRSTYLRGRFGGFEGRALQAGDRILAGTSSYPLEQLAARTLPVEVRPNYQEAPVLDVILGPQTDFFTAESIETFLSQKYTVSTTSDRMGYRLEGPALTHRAQTELISEGMTFGAIQVPAHGQPIVMMADGPTTGGYPKIATVARADLSLLAQCVPGQNKIRFRKTTVARAQKKYQTLMHGIEKIVKDE